MIVFTQSGEPERPRTSFNDDYAGEGGREVGVVGDDIGDGVRSGGDFLIDAEMLFNRGDALKRVIDFFLEADDVLDLFSEVVEITADRFEFRADGNKPLAHDGANVILCCHVRDVGFGRHRGFDIGDVVGDRGEATIHLSFKISEAALNGR